jgi:ABC-type cobalamin/Fe3+-siderophores transport system ATPase subunit
VTATVGITGATAEPLVARGIDVQLGGRSVVHDASLALREGEITALVGPNGSGKSTVLRALARVVRPSSGVVLLDGRSLHEQPSRDVARRVGLLPQNAAAPEGVTVRQLVELGRQPYVGRLGFLRRADHEAIAWALEATAMQALEDRLVDTLSGGERQRAWLALALAQRTRLLLLDEPTTYLDVRHQLDVLELVRRLNRQHGLTVCWVLHDLNAAAAFSDRMVWMRDGRIVASGPPADLLTPDLVARTFDVHATVVTEPRTGRPVCLPFA